MVQAPRLDALSVLVIDDSRHMCELIATLLRSFNVNNVHLSQTVPSAIDVLSKRAVDIIITDLAMHPIDGIAFVKSLRWENDSPAPFAPVLMITGFSDRQRVEAARDAGVNEFLVKPVTARALFDRLVAIIDTPRAFVRSQTYMGPDRRRRRMIGFKGPYRRSSDNTQSGSAMEI